MPDDEFEELVLRLKARYAELTRPVDRKIMLDHLRSLARWRQDPMDYPEVKADFPDTIHIADAVCHPECGRREFIVEGSTQECQGCGSLMFRGDIAEYRRKYVRI